MILIRYPLVTSMILRHSVGKWTRQAPVWARGERHSQRHPIATVSLARSQISRRARSDAATPCFTSSCLPGLQWGRRVCGPRMAALQAAASQLNPVASTVVACHPQRRTTHSRGPLTPRPTARRAHLLNTPSPVVRLGGQGAWQREHPDHHGRRVRMCYQDGEGELATQSRRSIVQAGAATALLAVLYPLPVLAETGQSEPDQGETKAEKARADMEAWYRVRGDGFAMSVPPSYEDVVEYDESGNSLYGERAKEKPFLARFASPDRKEVLSVVARNGSQLKLSFLQTQDITEFGSLEEAAKIFVPAGSKIVAAATRKPTDSRVPRTYYLYEFLARDDKRVVMSAAAAGGRVFVFGAMAPNSRWKEVGSTMRSAALNFALR